MATILSFPPERAARALRSIVLFADDDVPLDLMRLVRREFTAQHGASTRSSMVIDLARFRDSRCSRSPTDYPSLTG